MSRTVANARWRGKRPALSVLIPFYRDDPCDLLRDLNDEAGQVGRSVEVIVLSDGGGDADLVSRVEAVIKGMTLPARLLKRAPGMGVARPLLKTVAMTEWLPAGPRAFSLRLYRAALYAEAV